MEQFIKEVLHKDLYQVVRVDNNFKGGHGHTLSVKIVVPSFCQAHCPFCFNQRTSETQTHDWEVFMYHLSTSMDILFEAIKNRRISLDITGNEPTFDCFRFAVLMKELKRWKTFYGDRIDKIVLTTNGYHLSECMADMCGVVDIVNISLHHWDYDVRRNDIFRTQYIPSNKDLISLNERLNNIGITTTSVAVIDSVCDIKYFVKHFAQFSKEHGFKNARIRFNFITDDVNVRSQFGEEFEGEQEFIQAGLGTKILDIDGYNVNLYLGVPDLVDYVLGVELVIDDDGKLYIDYNKRYNINSNTKWELLYPFDQHIYVFMP